MKETDIEQPELLGAVGRIPEKCRIMETMGSESLIKNEVDYIKCSY